MAPIWIHMPHVSGGLGLVEMSSTCPSAQKQNSIGQKKHIFCDARCSSQKTKLQSIESKVGTFPKTDCISFLSVSCYVPSRSLACNGTVAGSREASLAGPQWLHSELISCFTCQILLLDFRSREAGSNDRPLAFSRIFSHLKFVPRRAVELDPSNEQSLRPCILDPRCRHRKVLWQLSRYRLCLCRWNSYVDVRRCRKSLIVLSIQGADPKHVTKS